MSCDDKDFHDDNYEHTDYSVIDDGGDLAS